MATSNFKIFVFLAVATILLASGGHATAAVVDLCNGTDYQPLCRSVIRGITDTVNATKVAINALVIETENTRPQAKSITKSGELDVCNEMLDDAIDNLKTALQNIKDHDIESLKTYLSAVVTDYVTCDDAYAEFGKTSPLAKGTKKLQQMASNCLALSSQMH